MMWAGACLGWLWGVLVLFPGQDTVEQLIRTFIHLGHVCVFGYPNVNKHRGNLWLENQAIEKHPISHVQWSCFSSLGIDQHNLEGGFKLFNMYSINTLRLYFMCGHFISFVIHDFKNCHLVAGAAIATASMISFKFRSCRSTTPAFFCPTPVQSTDSQSYAMGHPGLWLERAEIQPTFFQQCLRGHHLKPWAINWMIISHFQMLAVRPYELGNRKGHRSHFFHVMLHRFGA